ncbi:hypothetical protein [Myxosarcina sp. GI1]|uniref:hypothetical protein n=1 Tax=Myxosarcina sp. GI1 TaxID=1541065 RepID=UPI000563338A|nr:hypothetical protein [Myxosarcina sp. GI1]
MSYLPESKHQLFFLHCLADSERENLSIRQVQILKLKLKEEKLRDKIVYQSIKDKMSKKEKIATD